MAGPGTSDLRIGLLDPAFSRLVVDLLGVAEENMPLPELVARVGERLSAAFAPDCLAGLVVHKGMALPRAAQSFTPSEFARVLDEALPRLDTAICFEQRGGRRDGINELLKTVDHAEESAACSWFITDAGHRWVLWWLCFSYLQPDHIKIIHEILQMVMVTVFGRHRMAREARQRLHRAESLYTILEEITSNLDVQQVLTTIVDCARTLLESDSAYLAEVDETSQTVKMRVSTGIADEAYQRSSIAIGKGLAGVVASTGQVLHSSDYLADPRFVHTAATDANMLREGMRAALAAPLLTDGRVHGVLAVTNHRLTDFSADDVQLIKSLADGAAIAVENARLYAVQRGLVSQLQELNALTTRQHEALKRVVLIHDQLTELVLQGHGVDIIAQRLFTLIGNPVLVLGKQFTLLAAAGLDAQAAAEAVTALSPGRWTPPLAAAFARLRAERRPIHLAPDVALGLAESRILAPVMVSDDLLGYVLVIESLRQFGELDFQALEHASTVFALEFTRERAIAEVENRLRGDFVHDLVTRTFQQASIGRRAARFGHDLALPQIILAVSRDPVLAEESVPTDGEVVEQGRQLERTLLRGFQRRGAMVQTSVIGDAVIVLLALPPQLREDRDTPLRLVRELQRDVASAIKPGTASIGVSRVVYAPSDLAQAYHEARQALRTRQHFGARASLIEFEQLGIERLLSSSLDSGELAQYIDHKLGPLLAYDAKHGTALAETLDIYLDSSCRQRETALRLGIHVNSLCYRLGRIEDICGIRLEDARIRLDLHVALRMRRMLGMTAGTAQPEAASAEH